MKKICKSFAGEDNVVGNIFENSLEEIFNSDKFVPYMEKLFVRQQNNSKCKKCLLSQGGLCTGGCPADQYEEVGNFSRCSSQCLLIRENFKNNLVQRILL